MTQSGFLSTIAAVFVPWGDRGARPVLAPASFKQVPGVADHPLGAALPLDVAVIYKFVPPPSMPSDFVPHARFREAAFAPLLRPYQREAAGFLVERAHAVLALPMRTGKTLVSIAAAAAIGAERVLVLTPGAGKYVWQDEVERWLGRAPLLFEGRSGHFARRRCSDCAGRGADNTCPTCRQLNGSSYGSVVYEARTKQRARPRAPALERVQAAAGVDVGPRWRVDLRGRPVRAFGPRLPTEAELAQVPVRYTCSVPEHADMGDSTDPEELCPACLTAFMHEVRTASWVVANYELVVGQAATTLTGGDRGTRRDLPGLADLFADIPWDVVILDEADNLAGRSTGRRVGRARCERTRVACAGAKRVWLTTGTLLENTAGVWGPLDLASKGLFGSARHFDERYAGGHVNEFGGWVNKGRTELAETELAARLSCLMFRRERADILKELPPKQQVVRRIEAPLNGYDKMRLELGVRPTYDDIAKSSRLTLGYKIERLVEAVLEELRDGQCAYVLCFLKESAELVYNEIRKAALRERALRQTAFWLAHGDETTNERRVELSRDFRLRAAARLPGVWVATHDAMAGSISMKGALATHVVELHWKVNKLRQAIERPFELGTTGFTEVYYIVQNSIDDRMLHGAVSKLETQHRITGDADADAMRQALLTREESLDSIDARLTAHLSRDDDTFL